MLGEMASYGRPGGGDGADASAPKPQAGPSPTAGLALLSAEAGKAAAAAATAEPDARQKRAPRSDAEPSKRAASDQRTFPYKLYALLERATAEQSAAISWTDDGRGFVVRDQKALVEELLPRFFKATKFRSFTRQLNLWGFWSLRWSINAWDHPHFVRGNVEGLRNIERVEIAGTGKGWAKKAVSQKKKGGNADQEKKGKKTAKKRNLCDDVVAILQMRKGVKDVAGPLRGSGDRRKRAAREAVAKPQQEGDAKKRRMASIQSKLEKQLARRRLAQGGSLNTKQIAPDNDDGGDGVNVRFVTIVQDPRSSGAVDGRNGRDEADRCASSPTEAPGGGTCPDIARKCYHPANSHFGPLSVLPGGMPVGLPPVTVVPMVSLDQVVNLLQYQRELFQLQMDRLRTAPLPSNVARGNETGHGPTLAGPPVGSTAMEEIVHSASKPTVPAEEPALQPNAYEAFTAHEQGYLTTLLRRRDRLQEEIAAQKGRHQSQSTRKPTQPEVAWAPRRDAGSAQEREIVIPKEELVEMSDGNDGTNEQGYQRILLRQREILQEEIAAQEECHRSQSTKKPTLPEVAREPRRHASSAQEEEIAVPKGLDEMHAPGKSTTQKKKQVPATTDTADASTEASANAPIPVPSNATAINPLPLLGENGGVCNKKLLEGKHILLLGRFPEVSSDTLAAHRAITNMLEAFGAIMTFRFSKSTAYVLAGKYVHRTYGFQTAKERENIEIVNLDRMQRLLRGELTIEALGELPRLFPK